MATIRKTIESDEQYLRQISLPVDLNDLKLNEEIKLLEEFCLANECYALAAVQIGILKRIVYLKNTTLDVSPEDITYNESKILINPVVISKKGYTKYWEACLSCLDNMGLVIRPYEMIVEYFDENGVSHNQIFKGFESTVLSHEMDHLDGILHMDVAEEVLNMSVEERKIYRKTHPYEVISESCEFAEKEMQKNYKK